jgi:PRTRC genetic system protein B
MNRQMTNGRIRPRRAIIVYHDERQSNYYLESREIKPGKSGYSFMAPAPLATNVLKEIAQSFTKNDSGAMGHEKLVGAHILHGSSKPGRTVVAWYRPPTRRMLNFEKNIKIKPGISVNLPATLYMVVDTKLYLYALMSGDRPDDKTKLYNAPFFNIYETGNVCLGTAAVGKHKARTFELEADRFERAFYMAEQNGGQANQCKTPLAKLWNNLIHSKAAFPSKKELIQHAKYKTLGHLFEQLIPSDHAEE